MEGIGLKFKSEYSYFQVVNEESRTGLKLVKKTTPLVVAEIAEYLSRHKIPFNLTELNKAVTTVKDIAIVELCRSRSMPIREEFTIDVTDNKMKAVGRFYPPSNDGKFIDKAEILSDLRFKGILYGINGEVIDDFIAERSYCTNVVLASGKEVRHGKDAYIEYLFNTNYLGNKIRHAKRTTIFNCCVIHLFSPLF